MTGYWVQALVALLVGVVLVAVVLRLRRRASVDDVRAGVNAADARRGGPGVGEVAGAPGGPIPVSAVARDPWLREQNRCEQAVCRAARAVDTVSSEPARRSLRRVVHRMDAELPYVRALAELGRSLEPAIPPADDARSAVPGRVRTQLVEAATRFEAVTDDLARSVAELVADADLDGARARTASLRERFPLVASMSTLVQRARLADDSASTSAPDADFAGVTQ